MANYPTGTVTFLFTDIEGSTKLWEQYPDAMKVTLARHDDILREAIATHAGHVVKTTGDGVHAAFAVASDALNACLAVQRALQRMKDEVGRMKAEQDFILYPSSLILQVRMGLHTGAAEYRAGDYYGSSVNRAARIMSLAHSGQILLSLATAELVRGSGAVPDGVTLRDLGEHRLKGLLNPERLLQVVAPDLPQDFPPLASLNAIPNNLLVQLTSFVGREQAIAEVKRLLTGKDLTGFHASRLSGLPARLLTLTGSGGTGKTRLSLQVAADELDTFHDGVWFVELAPLADHALLPQTIASVLGVREESNRPLIATLGDYLHNKQLLFILDNCEHLIEACAQLSDQLLRACPQLKILASSREALGIAGETTYRVPSLEIPNPKDQIPIEQLTQYEAVRLFIERAVAVKSDFQVTNANAPAVAQICQRVDGIPLALELAAARIKSLSVEQIAARLDNQFRLLTGGSRTALPRQQTLRALIDWSHNLLSETERILFRRLAVFAGGWTLEAAEQVAGDRGRAMHGTGDGGNQSLAPDPQPLSPEDVVDVLDQLVNKSLVVVEEQAGDSGAVRYRYLETIRQYAREKLMESNEVELLRQRHLDFYTRLAEDIEPKLEGGARALWFNQLDPELDNLRAALEWAMGSKDIESGLRLASALSAFWFIHGHSREALQVLRELLSQPEAAAHTLTRVKALLTAGYLAGWVHTNYLEARPLLEETLALAQELHELRYAALAQQLLGVAAMSRSAYAEAHAMLANSSLLFQTLGDEQRAMRTKAIEGDAFLLEGDYARAAALFEECIHYFSENKSLAALSYDLRRSGQTLLRQGRPVEQAVALIRRSLTMNHELGDKQAVAACLAALAEVAMAQENFTRAATLFGAADALLTILGNRFLLVDQTFYERNLAVLRAQLPAADFDAAWEAGRKLTLEQAVAFALDPKGFQNP